MQMFTRKNQCKWIIFLAVAILTLVFLIVGAVALVMMSENRHIPTRTDHDNTGNALLGAGDALVETDIALESMDYLVEGVIGSTS